MTYKLAPHVTEEMLKEVGFVNEVGTFCFTRDIGIFCDVQQENETLFIDREKDSIWCDEIMFNGGWMDLDIKDYIQDLIDKGWVIEE